MKIAKIKTRKSFSSNFTEMLIVNFKYLACGFESVFWIRFVDERNMSTVNRGEIT